MDVLIITEYFVCTSTLQVDYPEITEHLKPLHRVMSVYEQRTEAPNKQWQYLLFTTEPYLRLGLFQLIMLRCTHS